jgi:hypothetical protein
VIDKLKDPKNRVRMAILLLGLSLVLWPLSAFTWAKDEPPFVLSLSWLAIVLTAVDILSTSDTRKQVDE